jgi:[ribosomal protein S18]-alanine N-acetyltransferase
MHCVVMQVRRANRGDYLEVAALDRAVWLPYPNGSHLPDGEHTWRHWIEDAIVVVLCNAQVIAGAALAFPRLDGGFWLHKIFVDSTQRKQGGGRLLMEKILAEIDKRKADCYLTVNPANEHAAALYRSFGFAADAISEGYYRKDEPRYEMKRSKSMA